MTEFPYPGVYVEEYDARPKPIPGVSASTDDAMAQSLARELGEVVRRFEPDWTDRGASDPGVTILEVLAWLSGALLYRSTPLPDQGRRAAMRALATLSTIADSCGAVGGSLMRPNYFAGRILDATTLQAEQDYHRAKLRRHNLALHGFGIVEGLEVQVEEAPDAPPGRVRVSAGYALDSHGNDTVVRQCVAVALPQGPEELFVSLRYQEIPCGQVPSPAGEPAFSWIEACVVALVNAVAAPRIALARLLYIDGKWNVDPSFVPPRASRG